jgi:hypothetical protein
MEKVLNSIDKKLTDIMILLMNLEKLKDEKIADQEKLKLLSDAGITNKDLAILFNKTSQQVADQLYKAKKSKKGKAKND